MFHVGALICRRGHTSDVYSISWSPDCSRIASGSVDNTSLIWDAEKGTPPGTDKITVLTLLFTTSFCSAGRILQTLKDHNNFVQGVAWDPLGDYVATQSCDRSLRVYGLSVSKSAVRSLEQTARNEQKQNAASDKAEDNVANATSLPFYTPPKRPFNFSLKSASRYYDPSVAGDEKEETNKPKASKRRLYMDETVPSFFRRPDWTPDGSILIAPCGQSPDGTPTSFLYARHYWDHPAIQLPGIPSPSVAVRSSKALYRLREKGDSNLQLTDNSLFDFPYRSIFAVASLESILFYDTQQPYPIGAIANVHFEKLTDLAW